jgi:Na+/H+-dicarboxylate symporter
MNEQKPVILDEEAKPRSEPLITEAVGQIVAAQAFLKGAGTLPEVLGYDAATHLVKKNESNRQTGVVIARRIYPRLRSR